MNNKIVKTLEKNPAFLKTVYDLSKEFLDEELAHEVRLELSSNNATPLAILETLIKDEDKEVRLNVLKLSVTSSKIIQSALKDEEDEVRLTVLKLKYLEEEDLINLFSDKCPEVVALARKTLKSRL